MLPWMYKFCHYHRFKFCHYHRFYIAAKLTTPLVFTTEVGVARNYNAGDIIHFNRILADFGSLYDRLSGIVTAVSTIRLAYCAYCYV